MRIKYIDNTTAQVTKAFEKQARIFGTAEYKLWREYLKDFPEAKMVTKKITKKPDKKTNLNLTYPNIEKYIKAVKGNEAQIYLDEFESVKEASCVQKSPYHYVIEWFNGMFPNYKSHEIFINNNDKNVDIHEVKKAVNE